MLDLYKLQVFAQVAQAGSFSAAATQLYMTQPAVSQHIQELEGALGVKLFERGRRGVTLTPEGTTLAEYAARIVNLVGEAESAVTNVANLASGEVSIGATPGVGTYLLPQWIQDFRTRYPDLSVVMQTGTTTEIVAQLVSRQIDLGFVEGELEQSAALRLDSQVLCDVPQLLVVGPKHSLWRRKSIKLAELDGEAFITRQPSSQTRLWLDQVLEVNHVHPRIVGEFDNPDAIKRSITLGVAMGVLPLYAVQAEVNSHALHAIQTDAFLSRELRAIWNKTMPLSPVARVFKTFADQCLHGGE